MNTSMNFTSFTQSIINYLQKKLGDDYKIFSNIIKKNNGIELTGIIIEEKGCNTSPTIYINDLYEEYKLGKSFTETADAVYDIFSRNRFTRPVDLTGFLNFDKAKEQIAYKLINYEKNKELLEDIPYKMYFNLVIVFYYSVMEPPFCGKAEILIHNKHLEKWGVGLEELCRIAAENTPRLYPAEITYIEDAMPGMFGTGAKAEKIPMFILTNQQKLQGAVCMLYPDVIKAFAEKIDCDLYILPSSIHEVILVPVLKKNSKDKLLEIVTEINATQVENSEILADSVYIYERAANKIDLLC